MKKLTGLMIVVFMIVGLWGCSREAEQTPSAERLELQILATSDIHGKFAPYDYMLNADSTSGSLAQIGSYIHSVRDENTLVIDCGDIIQGNSAELFLAQDIHPMIQGLNMLQYDIWVAGNHEFNFGIDVLKKATETFEGDFLCGNVYDTDGAAIGCDYVIKELGGIKVAVIGMVTPNISHWDAQNLKDCRVTDPADEISAIMPQLQEEADVIIAAVHMGENNEFGVPNSGAYDLADRFPEIDLILAAHDHKPFSDVERNGVLIVENADSGKSVIQANILLEKHSDGTYQIIDRQAQVVDMAGYAPDPEILTATAQAHAVALAEAEIVIGQLINGPLAPEGNLHGIPYARVQPTPLINLIHEVQLYYSGADVSAASLFVDDANLSSGDIRNCDASFIYKYDNTLYKLEMTGAQLKKYMEWSAGYFGQCQSGDTAVSVNPDMPGYLYDMFYGVNYEIDVSKPEGERIRNLTWPDGTGVQDTDVFTIAVNDYRASSQLLFYGAVFQDGDQLPELLEIGIRGDIGGVRELIAEYIKTEKQGIVDCNTLSGSTTWKITGFQ